MRSGSKKSFTRRLEERGVVAAGWQGKERLYSGIRKRTDGDAARDHLAITGLGGNSSFSPPSNFNRKKTGESPTSCEPEVLEEALQRLEPV